jgi:hypothetical protein
LRLIDVNGASTFLPSGAGRADGTFEIANIMAGTYTMASAGSNSRWWLRSVMVSGRDVLDAPLEMGAGGDITDAIVTFSDRHTELSGTLQTPSRTPTSDYFVVAFSRESSTWRLGARRVQFTRPSTDGRFAFRDLPPGDYLIAALTDLEPLDLGDASFLERLVSVSVPIHLGEGEQKTQDVRIVR